MSNLPVCVTMCRSAPALHNHQHEGGWGGWGESDLEAGAEVGGVVGVVVVVVPDALAQVPGETLLSLRPQLEANTRGGLDPG